MLVAVAGILELRAALEELEDELVRLAAHDRLGRQAAGRGDRESTAARGLLVDDAFCHRSTTAGRKKTRAGGGGRRRTLDEETRRLRPT